LYEHWSLVLTRPGEVSKSKFLQGDFESVGPRQCIERIEKVCEENLAGESKCFQDLAADRNRVIHFFHATYTRDADPKQLEEIVIKQLRAGVFLMRLLRHRWKQEFSEHKDAIDDFEQAQRKNKKYLKAKFDIVKPEIRKFKDEGGFVATCNWCMMRSALVIELGEPLERTRCLVCESRRNHITVKCPECGRSDIEFDAGEGTCGECEKNFNLDFLLDQFGGDDGAEAYCPECEYSEEETVVAHGDGYLCLACGNQFDRIGSRGWCNENIAGDISESYTSGCMFCEGYIGHHRDD
jgi:ssDNA-binding Zn-finger/Zn-ribbon topoisomerase 1